MTSSRHQVAGLLGLLSTTFLLVSSGYAVPQPKGIAGKLPSGTIPGGPGLSTLTGTPRPTPSNYFKQAPQVQEYCFQGTYRGFPITPGNANAVCSQPASPSDQDYICWQYISQSCNAATSTHSCANFSATPGPWCEGRSVPIFRPAERTSWSKITRTAEAVPFGAERFPNSFSIPFTFDDFFTDAGTGTFLAGEREHLLPMIRTRDTYTTMAGVPVSLFADQLSRSTGAVKSCENYIYRKFQPYSTDLEAAYVIGPLAAAEFLLGNNGVFNELKGRKLGGLEQLQGLAAYPSTDVEFKGAPYNGPRPAADVTACETKLAAARAANTVNFLEDELLARDILECWSQPFRAYPSYTRWRTANYQPIVSSDPDGQFQIGNKFMTDTLNFEDLKYELPQLKYLTRNAFLQVFPAWLHDRDPGLLADFMQAVGGTITDADFNGTNFEWWEAPEVKITQLGNSGASTDLDLHQAAYKDIKKFWSDVADPEWLDVEARERAYLKLIARRTELLATIACYEGGGVILSGGACSLPTPDDLILGGWSEVNAYVSPEDLVTDRALAMVRDRMYVDPSTNQIRKPVVSLIDTPVFESIQPGIITHLRGVEDAWVPKVAAGQARSQRPALGKVRLKELSQTTVGQLKPFVKTSANAAMTKGVSSQQTSVVSMPLKYALMELDSVEARLTSALQYELDQGNRGCLFIPDNVPKTPGWGPTGPIDGPPTGQKGAKYVPSKGKATPTAARYTNVNMCDWTPRKFTRDFSRALRSKMEQEFQECRAATADDFAAMKAKPGGNTKVIPKQWSDTTLHPTTAVSFDSNVARVYDYIHIVQDFEWRKEMADKKLLTWLKPSPVMKMRFSGEDQGTSFGDVVHHTESLGDPSLFAVSYGFDAAWKLKASTVGKRDFDTSSVRPVVSDMTGVTSAGFNVDVTIFGMHPFGKLVDTSLTMTTGKKASQSGYFKVLGAKKALQPSLNVPDASGTFDRKPPPYSEPLADFSVSAPFVILVIPVSLSAGLTASAGLTPKANGRTSGDGDQPGKLNMSMDSYIEPWVRADAWGSIAVDAVFAEVGARIDLNLATLGIPVKYNVSATSGKAPEGTDPAMWPLDTVHVSRDVSTQVDALAGSASLYAEICYVVDCSRAEMTIFSWEGLHQTSTVASGSDDFGMTALGWRMFGVRCLKSTGQQYDISEPGLPCYTSSQVTSP